MLVQLERVSAEKGTLEHLKNRWTYQKMSHTLQSWKLALKVSQVREAAQNHATPHLWAAIRGMMERPGFGIRMIEKYALVGDYYERTWNRLLAKGFNPRTCSFTTSLLSGTDCSIQKQFDYIFVQYIVLR